MMLSSVIPWKDDGRAHSFQALDEKKKYRRKEY